MKKPTFHIIKNFKENKAQLIDLLQHKWSSYSKDQRKKRFEWRYENNPYYNDPFIYLAADDDIVAGFRAFVFQKFVLNDNTFNIYSPADALVHPDYRRMGLFSKLNNYFLESFCNAYNDSSIILNLSSNKLSFPGNLKQGWQKTNRFKRHCFKISLLNFIITKTLKRNAFKSFHSSKIITKGGYEFELSQTLHCVEAAAFLEKNRVKNKFTNIRDEKYFKWRYSYMSAKYRYVYCRQNNELVGYCIIMQKSSMQYILEEYFSPDNRILKKMIKHASKDLSIPVLRTVIFSGHQKKLLKTCGFIQEPDLLLKILKIKRLPALVRPTSMKPEEKDFFVEGKDIRDMENWLLYQADVH